MLVETKTLEGYQLPHGQWLITVAKGSPISIAAHGTGGMLPPGFKPGTGAYDGYLVLPNYREMTMPQAGGAGQVFLTFAGIVCIGLAAVYLIVSGARRKGAKRG